MTKDREQIMRVNGGIGVQDVKMCLLCSNEGMPLYQNLKDRLFSAPGIWSLMYCPKCDLVWLNPCPLPSDIGKLYLEYYTHQQEDSLRKWVASLREAVKTSILQASFGYSTNAKWRCLGRVLSLIGPLKEIAGGSVMWLKGSVRGRLLDVGCGNGRFLAQMKNLGWDVMGVESDPKAVAIAKEHFKVEVFQGTLDEANFPDSSFDAVTMNHVIEHVPHPVDLLKECRRVLKAGGKLVVVTPNIKSLGERLFGNDWYPWDPPRHLFLFSHESLQTCAVLSGLRVQRLYTIAREDARWIWAAGRIIKRDGKLPGGLRGKVSLQLRLEGLMFWAVEYAMSRYWHMGEELVLEAVK